MRIFYDERIHLASKLRKLTKMTAESAIFRQETPHKFSDTDSSNHIISWFTHFKQPYNILTVRLIRVYGMASTY